MIYVTFEEGIIKANRFTIVNLKKPFRNIIHTEKMKEVKKPKPSSYYENKRGKLLPNLSAYYVEVKATAFGSLFKANYNSYPSFWVYETNQSLSPLFRDKVIHKILDEDLLLENETSEKISQHIKVIVNILTKSYDFDLILTDIENLTTFTWAVPIIYDNSVLNKLPWNNSSPRLTVLQGILKKHPEGIPLKLLDSQTLNLISLKHTTFDLNQLQGHNNILIISGTNCFYAGFITKELRKLKREGDEYEPLPVSLFNVI